MRPIMGDTPAAETAKKTQSRIVEAKDVTSIASFVDETSGKVKRRRSERRHRSKTDELQSNFFILEGPNGASHAMLPHRRGDAPTWHTYGFYFDSNGLPENPSFEQAFARVENNFPEGWYCAHDINADFVPPVFRLPDEIRTLTNFHTQPKQKINCRGKNRPQSFGRK